MRSNKKLRGQHEVAGDYRKFNLFIKMHQTYYVLKVWGMNLTWAGVA